MQKPKVNSSRSSADACSNGMTDHANDEKLESLVSELRAVRVRGLNNPDALWGQPSQASALRNLVDQEVLVSPIASS